MGILGLYRIEGQKRQKHKFLADNTYQNNFYD